MTDKEHVTTESDPNTPPEGKRAATFHVGEAVDPISESRPRTPSQRMRSQIHVSLDLHDLVIGVPITPEEAEVVRHRRMLNDLVHRILTVGLALSTVAMIAGIVLDIAFGRSLPRAAPRARDVLTRVFELHPSGFLGLGLLMLIATPIVRVFGSFIAFLYERDWRYAGITLLVLLILAFSLVSGRA